LSPDISAITKRISDLCNSKDRVIVGIAGPPAAGKSTISASLEAALTDSVVVPMDGFHLDNQELDALNLRDRKGAPDTFDADGFVDLVHAIKSRDNIVPIPEFDRSLDAVVNRGLVVEPRHRVILVEGNYLFLDKTPWDSLRPLFDLQVFLKPPLADIENRLLNRWREHGYSEQEAQAKAEMNDMPNARFVLAHSMIKNDAMVVT
jgi:pantothenate kinase